MRLLRNNIMYIILFGLIVSLYNSDYFMFQFVDKINNFTDNKFHLSTIRNRILKAVDNVNPLKSNLFNSDSNIKIINIQISKKNIDFINGVVYRALNKNNIYSNNPYLGYNDNNFTKDTKCKLYFEGEKYNAKLKLAGSYYPNFINPKKSYSIKLSKKKLFDQMRRFSLYIIKKESVATIFSYKIYEKYMNMQVNSEIVRLKFNGIDQGLYVLEEKLSQELLEKNNLSGVDFTQPIDEWNNQYRNGHEHPYIYDLSNTKYKNNVKFQNGQLLRYNFLHKTSKIDELKKLIDIDKFAKFEAMRVLFGDYHPIEGDNLRLLYDNSTGIFFPYFRMEGSLKILTYSMHSRSFEKSLYANFRHNTENKLFKKLIRDNKFRTKRNEFIYKIVNDSNTLLSLYDEIFNKYKNNIYRDNTNKYSSRKHFIDINKKRDNLSSNLKMMSKYIHYSIVHTELIQENDKQYLFTIKPDSNSLLKINKLIFDGIPSDQSLEIENLQDNSIDVVKYSDLTAYFNDEKYMLDLDEDLELQKTIFKYRISFKRATDIKNYKISFLNTITNNYVKERNIYRFVTKYPDKFSFDYIQGKENKYINDLNLSKKYIDEIEYLVLKRNEYVINQDMVFPYGQNLFIENGTKLHIDKNCSIIVYGNLLIESGKEKTIIANKTINKPFGVLAVIGNGETKVNISDLELFGGYQDKVNGMFLSGALSLYNHKNVTIKNSFIHHNSADDGLNIKNSNILLQKNIFNANMADQVDLDFCEGMIEDNRFVKESLDKNFNQVSIPTDDNGDGLDFSGSKILVRNNEFIGFLDKGISIGENTLALISHNNFIKNRSALTAKDQSKVYILNNNYQGNQISLEMYQKKKIFKHPSVFNINEQHEANKIKKTVQSHYYKLSNAQKIEGDITDMHIFDELANKNWIEYE